MQENKDFVSTRSRALLSLDREAYRATLRLAWLLSRPSAGFSEGAVSTEDRLGTARG